MNRVVLSLGLVWQLASMFASRILTLLAALFLGGMMGRAQDSTQVQYRYPSGAVSSEGWLVDGIPEGYWRSFYADGTWKSEGNRLRGELEGEWVFYDEAGRVQTTLNYVGGLKNGEEIRWDSSGVQRRILPWTLDALQGEERVLDGRGMVVETIPWDNGKREGVALGFATDANQERGRIIRRMGYRNDLLRWVEEVNRYDDQGRKTGKWLTFWSNGRIREEGPWERGLKEGVFKRFSRQGDLEGTETWHRGELVEDAPEAVALDLRKAFHPNGEVSRSGPWREDTPMGTHRFFDEQGHLVEVKVFREGVLGATGSLDSLGRRTGDWTEFWPNGEVRSAGPYKEGLREGQWTFYSRDGRVEQEGGYRAGQWHGRWVWYHLDGSVHRDEQYRKGREDGDFVEWSETGDVLAQGVYERGRKQGDWVEHVNDDRREGAYVDGERDGQWIHFDAEGNVVFEGAYVAGIPTGEHVAYWPSGIREWIGSYKGGLRDGNWRYFDGAGSIRLIRQYEAGRIVKVNGAKTDR